MRDVLERYFDAMRTQDWQSLADCLADDVHRTGPYLDHVRGKQAYVDFLAGVIPQLRNYALEILQIRELAGGGALVELTESMDRDGQRKTYPEALLFDFDPNGRILRVDVYVKQPPEGR